MAVASDHTAIFVTARLRSSRLSEKMLIDIEGRPALWYCLDRMSKPVSPDVRVVCTTTSADDARIAEFAESQGWKVFRGDEEDVLRRYLGAATLYGIDFFVNVDGDDLFCSAEHVDLIIERYSQTSADYISCEGLPFGGAPIGVKVCALQDVCSRKGEADTQGWGKYFVQSGLYHVEMVYADEALRRPEYRMTLDYREDLEFFRTVVSEMDPNHAGLLGLREVVSYLDSHTEVAGIIQKMTD
jgi:spore coat polysaccharide biosynthesis protein SpsF